MVEIDEGPDQFFLPPAGTSKAMQTRIASIVLATLGAAVISASLFAMYVEGKNAAVEEMLKPVAPVASTHAIPTKAAAAKAAPTQDEIDRSRKLSAEAASLIDSYTGAGNALAQALSSLEQALALDERNADAYVEMARYQMKVAGTLSPNVLALAEQSLRKGLTFDPQHGNSYVLLGYVLAHEGRVQPAMEAFNKAHELSATSPWLDMNIGELLLMQGDIEGALHHYETVTGSPTIPTRVRAQAYEAMARQYAKDGKGDLAKNSYVKALALQPEDAWTMGNYSRVLRVSMLDTKESEKWARRALEKMDYGFGRESLGSTLYLEWAEALIKEKNSPKAEKIYAEAQRYVQGPDELLHEISGYPRSHPIIEALAAKGYSLDHFPEIENGSGDTPIGAVVASKNLPILKQLVASGANVDALGYKGSTALMVAAYTGDVAITEFLLSKGANPYLLEARGSDAESLARAQGHPDVAELIAKAKLRSPEKRDVPAPDGLPKVGQRYRYRGIKRIPAGNWDGQFSAGEVFIYEGTGGLMNGDRSLSTEFVGLRFSPEKQPGARNWTLKKSTPNDWSNYFEEAGPKP